MHERQHPSTIAVTSGRPARDADAPINQPIVPASTFHAGGELGYAREGNPSAEALETALGELEGGTAVVFSSGMAAANAILDQFPVGTRILAPTHLYTGVAGRLKEFAERGIISLTTVDVTDTNRVIEALTKADVLWLESPTNPMMEIADLKTCLAAAKNAEPPVVSVVDNTFATPVAQRPLELGADYVFHSVTKMISGHSDLLMGAVICSDPELTEATRIRRILLGAMPSPFDCFLALRGLRTLFLRFDKAQSNAQYIAQRLATHAKVSRVRYPGWGSMISIEVDGDADSVSEAATLWTYATSLGGVESLLERRRRWAFESELVPQNLIRLSLGIEHPEDLWADLDQALNGISPAR